MKEALTNTNKQRLSAISGTIDVTPNPEFLIKSIAEQGYSFEAALADLIDNSISARATHVEILVNPEKEPFHLFLADDGHGMDAKKLQESMHFPSASMESERGRNDLGRFGLGMKTASFSQTRKFTVLSREKGSQSYCGFTWDVNHLKSGNWEIIDNSPEELASLLENYHYLSHSFNGEKTGFEPNTIIVWEGLYKFEEFLISGKLRADTLKSALSETIIHHLSIVFHRFMERKADRLSLRVNNKNIQPFNPFPTDQPDFRSIDNKQTILGDDVVRLEGFVLPSKSIDESRQASAVWTTGSWGLMDLEGIYVYRADRIIVFGGWNDITKKTTTLRLARLRVEVGNRVDNLFHLNVAKSKIIVPFDIRTAFIRYVAELKSEAEKEYYNRGVRHFAKKGKSNSWSLFEKNSTDRGLMIEINPAFPLLSSLRKELSEDQNAKLSFILKTVTTTINNIRKVHQPAPMQSILEKGGSEVREIQSCIRHLQSAGIPDDYIKNTLLGELGYDVAASAAEIEGLLT
jgi:hypothetical protein